jgi:predicted transcriptional regulator
LAKLDLISINGGQDSSYRQRKRNRFEIYYDILTALNNEIVEHKRPSLTRVAAHVNMPYDRLRGVLTYLTGIGFCERQLACFSVTEKGMEFLLEYRRFNESIIKMGLADSFAK